MNKLLCGTIIIFLTSCTVITKRQFPSIDPILLQNQSPLKKTTMNIRLYIDSISSSGERYWDRSSELNTEILSTIDNTYWFSVVQLIGVDRASPNRYAEHTENIKNLDEFFKAENEPKSYYELSIYVRSLGRDIWFAQNILGFATLAVVPVREDFSYIVGFRLKSGRQSQPRDLILNETFTLKTSSIHYEGTKKAAVREFEPVLNLIKYALLEYRKQGLIK